jgi:hypothetical protein
MPKQHRESKGKYEYAIKIRDINEPNNLKSLEKLKKKN